MHCWCSLSGLWTSWSQKNRRRNKKREKNKSYEIKTHKVNKDLKFKDGTQGRAIWEMENTRLATEGIKPEVNAQKRAMGPLTSGRYLVHPFPDL